MKDSRMTPEWIAAAVAANPFKIVTDGANTFVLTCPVRLTFPNLFKPQANKQNPTADAKYGTGVLVPPGADMTPMLQLFYAECAKSFPEYRNPQTGQYNGLHNPFHDQGDKTRYPGYTPGAITFTTTSKNRPPVADAAKNPIADEARVYPGVWAIVSMNAYTYGKSPPQPKKGVGFGLRSVLIMADDTNIGSAAPADPAKEFAQVNVANMAAVPASMFTTTPVALAVPASAPAMPGMAPPDNLAQLRALGLA